MSDAIEIRAWRPGDEDSLLAAHNAQFAAADGPRSMAHWRWKYLDNPTGQQHIVIAVHETRGVVGGYITLPVPVQIEGRRAIAGQPVDYFVLAEFRRAGKRPGLFVNCALRHYELFGGTRADQNAFHYGWAVPGWRMGQRYLSYENIRDWDYLFLELHGRARTAPSDLEVRRVDRFTADADDLWAKVGADFRIAIVRDSRYLNWRYASATDHDYRLFECRERGSGALRGICVYRQCNFMHPGAAFVVDWVARSDDEACTDAMLAELERMAIADRSPVLATSFEKLDPRFLKFQRRGYLVHGTPYFTGVVSFDGHDTFFYRDSWYQTPGDSDLV